MLIAELPWRLERLLLGVLIAALAWATLQILSKTVFRRQPWRGLLLSSCLSVCSTVLAIAIASVPFTLPMGARAFSEIYGTISVSHINSCAN